MNRKREWLEIRGGHFPLTPALSLGEREKLFRLCGLIGSRRLNPAPRRLMVPMRVRGRTWRLPTSPGTSNIQCSSSLSPQHLFIPALVQGRNV